MKSDSENNAIMKTALDDRVQYESFKVLSLTGCKVLFHVRSMNGRSRLKPLRTPHFLTLLFDILHLNTDNLITRRSLWAFRDDTIIETYPKITLIKGIVSLKSFCRAVLMCSWHRCTEDTENSTLGNCTLPVRYKQLNS